VRCACACGGTEIEKTCLEADGGRIDVVVVLEVDEGDLAHVDVDARHDETLLFGVGGDDDLVLVAQKHHRQSIDRTHRRHRG
jgi:hypothetical protein